MSEGISVENAIQDDLVEQNFWRGADEEPDSSPYEYLGNAEYSTNGDWTSFFYEHGPLELHGESDALTGMITGEGTATLKDEEDAQCFHHMRWRKFTPEKISVALFVKLPGGKLHISYVHSDGKKYEYIVPYSKTSLDFDADTTELGPFFLEGRDIICNRGKDGPVQLDFYHY